ncbi:MAG: hypothetical protein ABI867_42645 [Kofleriaceae bacterium]
MLKSIGIATLCMGLAFACGGGSGDGNGIDDDTTIASLSDAELADECEVLLDLFPQRTIDCDGSSVDVGFENLAECTNGAPSDPGCPFTVGEAEDCFEALGDQSDADACGEVLPSECEASPKTRAAKST